MNQENKLIHNTSTWKTRKPACHIQTSFSLQHNDHRLKCNSSSNDEDDEGKEKVNNENDTRVEKITGRERLKRHREEVKVPENWEKEPKLKEWVDYTTFNALISVPHALIVTARDALIADVRKSRSQRLRIHN
ncbi:unnamed protein product [Lathyrus sativus]|nr:unnamed protein product [Lathyrus sativus]